MEQLGTETLVLIALAVFFTNAAVAISAIRYIRALKREHKLESDAVNTVWKGTVKELQQKLADAQKMYLLHAEKNIEFERQRNKVWDMYRLAGLQAGHGHTMLMNALQKKTLQLNACRMKLGEKPEEVDPQLKKLVDDYLHEHGSERPEELQV